MFVGKAKRQVVSADSRQLRKSGQALAGTPLWRGFRHCAQLVVMPGAVLAEALPLVRIKAEICCDRCQT